MRTQGCLQPQPPLTCGTSIHACLAAQLMEEASQEFPHLREHATFLDGCGHLLCWVHCLLAATASLGLTICEPATFLPST